MDPKPAGSMRTIEPAAIICFSRTYAARLFSISLAGEKFTSSFLNIIKSKKQLQLFVIKINATKNCDRNLNDSLSSFSFDFRKMQMLFKINNKILLL